MPLFQYKARGPRGDAISGTMEAGSSDAVATQLLDSNITPVEIVPASAEKNGSADIDLRRLFPVKVRITDLIQFSRQMYSLTKAGVPMLSALAGLARTTRNPTLAQAIRDITASLESGRDLATSMSQHPEVFSVFYVSMIRVGETSGQLDHIFLQLGRYLERDKKTRDQIKSATRYPMFVIGAVVLAIAIINIFVIPAFANMFARFGADLPVPTQVLIATSNFTLNHWPGMLVTLIALMVGLRYYVKTEDGRFKWDRMKLKLPLVGGIIYRATLARFTRLFSMSSRAGVPLITALNVVARALDNAYVEERVLNMQAGIERGDSITRTAAATGMFDSLVLQMMSVGEETGSIDELLHEVAEYYDVEVEYDIEKLSASIEPILTVFIGIIVLILALGVFLPMWDLAGVALRK